MQDIYLMRKDVSATKTYQQFKQLDFRTGETRNLKSVVPRKVDLITQGFGDIQISRGPNFSCPENIMALSRMYGNTLVIVVRFITVVNKITP